MKKILALSLVLAFAGSAMAATTYTENLVNKWTAPAVQKESQLRAKHDAAVKAQKEKQEAYKKAQEQRKKDLEAKKAANEKKVQEKKDALNTLMKW